MRENSIIGQQQEEIRQSKLAYTDLLVEYNRLKDYRQWQQRVTWIEAVKLLAAVAIAVRVWL